MFSYIYYITHTYKYIYIYVQAHIHTYEDESKVLQYLYFNNKDEVEASVKEVLFLKGQELVSAWDQKIG